jgi:uncharacterized protein (TIGR02147 family)
MDRAREALAEDEYKERNASSVTMSCDYGQLPKVIQRINEFRDQICLEFGLSSTQPDSVFQLNVQIFQLTDPNHKRGNNEKPS